MFKIHEYVIVILDFPFNWTFYLFTCVNSHMKAIKLGK